MEKQTRMSKYKELRDEMMDEVAIHHHEQEVIEEDDDFLGFLPKKEKKNIDDTLMEPLTYETLDKDDEVVRSALNKAKETVGKEQYNTRLDILNKIKSEDIVETKQTEEPARKMSLLEKLAAMSPDEDVEELQKYQEETSVKEFMKEEKKQKRSQTEVKKEEIKIETVNIETDEDEEELHKESKVIDILNYVIIGFMIVLVILVCFIIKQIFF